jgi:hypothetical protein
MPEILDPGVFQDLEPVVEHEVVSQRAGVNRQPRGQRDQQQRPAAPGIALRERPKISDGVGSFGGVISS